MIFGMDPERPAKAGRATHYLLCILVLVAWPTHSAGAQEVRQPEWNKFDAETLQHYQALLRLDTSSPPGRETQAVEYLSNVLKKEGIAVEIYASEPDRANLVARIKGNGRKRPLLIMGHTDVVTVDPTKWTHPPFGAVRDGGYIYGRGTIDDKDNLVASLMVMLTLKRQNVLLDRDVIFVAESGEEGGSNVGASFLTSAHLPTIDAEYCFAEGGSVRIEGGQARFAAIQTLEKHARTVEFTARGASGHASVPLDSNAIAHLSAALAAVTAWQAPIRLNATTRAYFERLASLSAPESATRYRAVLSPGGKDATEALSFFLKNEPGHASMLHTSVSPTVLSSGYRVNVIPSEATATLDVRMLPDEDPDAFLQVLRTVVNDPAVVVSYGARVEKPRAATGGGPDSDVFKILETGVTKHYSVPTIPQMSTAGTDMSFLRAKGIQCFGIGPATDVEDVAKGYGAHSDQERLRETELYRFVHFNWDIVIDTAKAK